MHGKHMSLSAHNKVFLNNDTSFIRGEEGGENPLPCAEEKNARQNKVFVVRCCFAVRPIKIARQTSSLLCVRNKAHDKHFDPWQIWISS
jgi:hypothetical protein